MSASRIKLLGSVRKVLTDRSFTDKQIEKITPRLRKEYISEPSLLAEVVDRWNLIMTHALYVDDGDTQDHIIPVVAVPPAASLMAKFKINLNTILADVEPDLLLLDPKKLLNRHQRVQGLGLIKNMGEHWTVLFNAPRGFYLQDWSDLLKKIYYIDQNVIDLLYDKKEQKEMDVHPLIKSAAATEIDFDHIRTRYLFALRSGYKSLSHMFDVQTASDRATLKDILLTDNEAYLTRFAPYCSIEEYNCFSNLIKNHEIDEDDAEICKKLAELDSLSYSKTNSRSHKT